MSVADLFFALGLIVAAFEQWTARGRSALAWAVILVCIGLLSHLVLR